MKGVVVYQNSGGRTAEGVSVEAFGANRVYTNNGKFILQFSTKKPGEKVKVIVGNSDKEGKNIEVVNTRQLEWLRIPNVPDEEPVEIIVCYAGQRDEAALRFYGILVKTYDKAYETRLNDLETQLQQKNLNEQTTATLIAQIDELKTERDNAIAKLEEQAEFMASINKDNASELVKEAIRKIEEEEDIEAALFILDNAKLEEAYQVALDKKLKAEEQIRQVVEGYELKISLLLPKFKYKEATECYVKIIEIWEANQYDQEALATYYTKAALVFNDDGKYKKALEFQNKSIAISEEILDPKHPSLATFYNNIALTYKDLGNYEKALEFQNKSIAISEEILDPKHPSLATFYNNIALTYQALGNYEKALEFQNKSIAIQEEILVPKHPSLASSYNNIGSTYKDLGNFEKALEFQNKSIAISEEILDPKHPSLATFYNNIALTYQALGNYEKALEFQNKSIAISEEILDPKHPSLASSYNNIALTYQALGNYEKALEFQNKSIAIREEILDPKHPSLATSYNNIALTYKDLGNYEKALEFQNKDIAISEEILDPKHPDLATSYNNIAIIYKALGNYEKALEFQNKSIAIREEILDPKHPFLATSYNNIGSTYKDLGNFEKALEFQNKSIAISEEILDPNHPDLASSYNNIALIYKDLGNFEKALEFQNKCISIFIESLPENHPYQQRALNSLLEIYLAKGLHNINEKNYTYALEDFHKRNEYNESDEAWNYIGLCHYYLGNHTKAIEAYKRALALSPEIKQQHYFNNIGTAYVKNQQFEEAKNAFTEYEKLFPNEGRTFRNWAMYYALQNEKDQAITHLQKAIELGYDNLEWLQTDDSLESIRGEEGYKVLVKKLEERNL